MNVNVSRGTNQKKGEYNMERTFKVKTYVAIKMDGSKLTMDVVGKRSQKSIRDEFEQEAGGSVKVVYMDGERIERRYMSDADFYANSAEIIEEE